MNYKVCLSTKINPEKLQEGSGILVIEPEDYTPDQIRAIRKKGYKVLGYLSIGTLEKDRPWYKEFSKHKRKQLPDWPREYYMNMQKTAWKKFLYNRATEIKEMGFDGLWLDNLDVYSEYKSKAEYTACYAILQKLKPIGGYIMVNGGSEFLDDTIDRRHGLKALISGYTQEEVFSLIKDYSGSGKFGKQRKEDTSFYKGLIRKLIKKKVECFCLEYTKDDTLKKNIRDWCKKNGAGYYISSDVNL